MTNNHKKLPGWVQLLLALLVPLIIGFAGYGALSERVTRLRVDVDAQVTLLRSYETTFAADLTLIKVQLAEIQVRQQEVQRDLASIQQTLLIIQKHQADN